MEEKQKILLDAKKKSEEPKTEVKKNPDRPSTSLTDTQKRDIKDPQSKTRYDEIMNYLGNIEEEFS